MKKFLVGCSIFAVVAVILSVGASFFVIKWLQSELPDGENLERYEREMQAQYGQLGEWVPPLHGDYDPERIALYVDLREKIVAESTELSAGFDDLVDPERERGRFLSGLISGTKRTMRLVRGSLELVTTADSLLIDAEMPRGEYAHYTLLLQHGYFMVDIDALLEPLQALDEKDDARKAVEKLAEGFRDKSREIFREQLRLARAIETETSPDSAWADELRQALSAREEDPFPLSAPLPAALLAAFDTHRSRLEATRPRSIGVWLAETPLLVKLEEEHSNGLQVNF
jgi:hypothetical protein